MTCVNPSSWAKDCPAYGVQQTRNAITKAQTLTIKHNVTIFLLIKAKVHNLKFENFKKNCEFLMYGERKLLTSQQVDFKFI